jgi:flagellar assembly factor FliW
MITAELKEQLREPETHCTDGRDIIRLPFGLLGFEHVKQYILLVNPAEEPFMWLQMLDDAKRAFLVAPPSRLVADYQPDISDDEVEFLELTGPEDAFLLNIVTLHGSGQATVNLKGPVVINRRTLIGKQVIPNNAAQYSLRHPLAAS